MKYLILIIFSSLISISCERERVESNKKQITKEYYEIKAVFNNVMKEDSFVIIQDVRHINRPHVTGNNKYVCNIEDNAPIGVINIDSCKDKILHLVSKDPFGIEYSGDVDIEYIK